MFFFVLEEPPAICTSSATTNFSCGSMVLHNLLAQHAESAPIGAPAQKRARSEAYHIAAKMNATVGQPYPEHAEAIVLVLDDTACQVLKDTLDDDALSKAQCVAGVCWFVGWSCERPVYKQEQALRSICMELMIFYFDSGSRHMTSGWFVSDQFLSLIHI